jgi:hypothetical protein
MANIIEDMKPKVDLTKVKLSDICKMYDLKIADVLNILKSQGMKADPEMTIEEVAKENGISTMDIFNTLTSHL